ncbi:hypothetical protein H6F46_16050 [Limnothrix sp. FACHB-1083]|uniref:hypothetical protein n=1 Tax=unclassified Limnothrix TaxID=2632864 RepID=UPI0016805A82|nr:MULTISPECIES: hypothetical protein [unclassified Limnothrix]MBD2162205.1 hypothetical protein [Limnothrix sp. FACHB-1083]MBD2193238.1 hypothetical protein [Limnothrix sp. FACHB-1088]
MNRTTNPLQIWQLATPKDRREFAIGLLLALSMGMGVELSSQNFYIGLFAGFVMLSLAQQQLTTTVLLRELGRLRELVDRSGGRAGDGPA